jgi:hypothetical protein
MLRETLKCLGFLDGLVSKGGIKIGGRLEAVTSAGCEVVRVS